MLDDQNPPTPAVAPLPPLKFHVAPHIVQDLGLNLYTTLPRVLVEFVANAYDADSADVGISLDFNEIKHARQILKADWELKRDKMKTAAISTGETLIPLGELTLPPEIEIVISDHGHGMDRTDLQEKFLVAGRRRRTEEGKVRSEGGRILMGRKGLGKLAGFGVAHMITIVSRKKGNTHATKILMDYEALINESKTEDVEIPEETLDDGGGIEPFGTMIKLSKLVYEPMKSGTGAIAHAIGDHFAIINKAEFAITLNGEAVTPTPRDYVYAYPKPEIPIDEFVNEEYESDDGETHKFQYRLRFTGEKKQLNARERGIRVYAHNRLASAPDMLDLKTGIHGFRNTYYLDGIVKADFIDDNNSVDYIATDRQSLRWESALLTPLRELLTEQMEKACNEYQKKRDKDAEEQAKKDSYTSDMIENSGLPKHRKKLAYRVAAMLEPVCQGGWEGEEYKTRLPIFLDGLGQGDVLTVLKELANKDHPDLRKVVSQIASLTSRELGDFMRVVQGRLDGIAALKKLYKDVNFKIGNNERQLHDLFEKNPWLIDPTFTQFLTSNKSEDDINARLSRLLEIGEDVPADYDSTEEEEVKPLGNNKRPDLVFLLSNKGLARIVVVELKAPNTPLHVDHLDQLEGYMRRTETWLKKQGGIKQSYRVEGKLIGSKSEGNSKAEKILALDDRIVKYMDKSDWRVYDIGEVLDRTESAHHELLDIYNRAELSGEADG